LDEIHLASTWLLEELSLVFNFQMDSRNPFLCILSGQTPVRSKLGLNVCQSLRQRLVVQYLMQGLTPQELPLYLKSRLELAGTSEDLFSPPAVEALGRVSRGVPRLVNNLATQSLLLAAMYKKRVVDEEIIYQAQQELSL